MQTAEDQLARTLADGAGHTFTLVVVAPEICACHANLTAIEPSGIRWSMALLHEFPRIAHLKRGLMLLDAASGRVSLFLETVGSESFKGVNDLVFAQPVGASAHSSCCSAKEAIVNLNIALTSALMLTLR